MTQNTTSTGLTTQSLLRGLLMVLAGSAFIAIAAQISVPFYPVPVTLQTLAILLVGFTFGSRLGALTLIAYLAEGAMGLPVFANGMNGLAFAGPTAGFLFGFVLMAWLAGLAVETGLAKNAVTRSLAAIVISALLYIPGLAWPMAIASVFGIEAGWVGKDFASYYWVYFMAPFLLGDAVKGVIAALASRGTRPALRKFFG